MTVCILYRGGFISRVTWPTIQMATEDMAKIGKFFTTNPESMEEVLNVWIQ